MKRLFSAAMLCLALTACKPEQGSDAGTANVIDATPVVDPNSFAQPDKVRIEHINLDLKVDMAAKVLRGSAEYRLRWLDDKANELV
ncbi:MAG: hypothetical protein KAY90_03965, partial [Arenimonas sp.]|nr:hypothetical protein [Arenimonas sp.]